MKKRIALVGDAPGFEEIEAGQPFVGSAGKILNVMLRTAGLDREDFFLTNVFSQRPEDDDLSAWFAQKTEAERDGHIAAYPGLSQMGWLRKEYHWELERLGQELYDADPNVVVPLGNTALWAFTGLSGIGSYRGSVLPASLVDSGRKLVPTFHPAMVMQQWKYFSVVVGDLLTAVREAEKGPLIVYPKRRLYLEPGIEDIKAYLPVLLASELLSVDIETGWGQLRSIGFAPNAEEAMSIPFVDLRQPDRSYWRTPEEEVEALMLVKQVLESPVPKLGQNYGGYDFYWLYDKYGIGTRNYRHDTRLMHHNLYPELEKSLEFMGGSYSEQGPWKTMGRHGEKRDD